MFVAGLGDDHTSWDAPIEYLSQKYRCVTYDNRGIGRSPITDGPYTTQQMAEDAQAIADQLGLEQLVAVGSSMGGAICQEWALAQPETVERLVLSNTWGGADAWFSALIEHWIQLAVRGAGADILYQLALFCFSPDYLSEHPETIEGVSRHRPAEHGRLRRCRTGLPDPRRPRSTRLDQRADPDHRRQP